MKNNKDNEVIIGGPNDRWPKRSFRNGFERMGAYFPDDYGPSPSLKGFLANMGHRDYYPMPKEFPDRPLIKGHKREILEARLVSLWEALNVENRLDVMDGILTKIQPIWRARAIFFLPLTPEEKDVLQGRWCRDTDPKFPKSKTTFHIDKNHKFNEMLGISFVKGRIIWCG
jgi:hypothetical protein